MALQTVATFGWIPVAPANVQGIPGGLPPGEHIQRCDVKFTVLFSPLAMERSLNITTQVITNNNNIRRYLTADENLIMFNHQAVGPLATNRLTILNNIMGANPPVNIMLNFNNNPGLPQIIIT